MDNEKKQSVHIPKLAHLTCLLLWIFTCTATFALFFFCDQKFADSESFFINLISAGAFSGTPDAHLLYSGALLGKLLSALGSIASRSWILYWELLLSLLSFLAVEFILSREMPGRFALLISAVLYAAVSRDLFILISIERTAAFALMSGGMLFIWSFRAKRGFGSKLFGFLLVFAGLQTRTNALILAGPFLLLYLVFAVIACIRTGGYPIRLLLSVLLAGCICLAGIVWNEAAYRDTGSYRTYRVQSLIYEDLKKGSTPQFSEISTGLEALEIDENDYALLLSGNAEDSAFFTEERLTKVQELVHTWRKNHRNSLSEIVNQYTKDSILFYPGTIGLLVLLILCLALSPLRFPLVIISAASAVCCLGLYTWLYGFSYTAASAILMCAMLFLSPGVRPSEWSRKSAVFRILPWPIIAALTGWLVISVLPRQADASLTLAGYQGWVKEVFDSSDSYHALKYRRVLSSRVQYPNFISLSGQSADDVYLIDNSLFETSLYLDFYPEYTPQSSSFSSRLPLGGVTMDHPAVTASLKAHGFSTEPLQSLLSPHVYFVTDSSADLILTYLRTHYDSDTRAELINTVDNLQIWSFSAD